VSKELAETETSNSEANDLGDLKSDVLLVSRGGFQWESLDHFISSLVKSRKQIAALQQDNGWGKKGSGYQDLVNKTTAINDLLSPDTVQVQTNDADGDLQGFFFNMTWVWEYFWLGGSEGGRDAWIFLFAHAADAFCQPRTLLK
jgi:hypothetical protein